MDLSTALAALRRGWAFVLVGILAAAAVATALHRTQAPTYASTGTYLVIPSATDPDIVENIKTLDSTRSRSLLTTLTEIMGSDTVYAAAAAAGGIDPTAAYTVVAAPLPEANGVTLQVTGPDPASAKVMADAIAVDAAQRFVDFYRIYAVSVLDPPIVPTAPSGPGLLALLILAGILGACAGGAAALLRNPDPSRRRSSVSRRIDAYAPNVTPLRDHDRFKRVG